MTNTLKAHTRGTDGNWVYCAREFCVRCENAELHIHAWSYVPAHGRYRCPCGAELEPAGENLWRVVEPTEEEMEQDQG